MISQSMYSQKLETFHDFWGTTIKGDSVHYSKFAGKKLLVVNTASYCGYTPQFADLAKLDSIYGGEKFAVIGFPCNDFGGQDPLNDSLINQFCTENYHVKFQMMSKVNITSMDTTEVYKWLQLKSRNGVANAAITWNFHKFCINADGTWAHHFPSTVNPLDKVITDWIEATIPTHVKEVEFNNHFIVYPNPTKEEFKIQFDRPITSNIEIQVIDPKGRKIESFTKNCIQETAFTIPCARLDAGVYYIQVRTGNNVNWSIQKSEIIR